MLSLAARLTWIITQLRQAVAVFAARPAGAPPLAWLGTQAYAPAAARPGLPALSAEAWPLLWQRLGRLAARFQTLFARWQAGRLPTRRPSRPGRLRLPSLRPVVRLPRGFGWVNRRIPAAIACAGQLEAALAHPDTEALVAAAPQAGRLLRPLCRALGIALPGWLALARRPRRPPRAAPDPAAPRHAHAADRPLPPHIRAAARAWRPRTG